MRLKHKPIKALCRYIATTLLLCTALSHPALAAEPEPVNLTTKSIQVPLGLHAQLLEDASKAWGLEQVVATPAGQWQASPQAVLNFSFSKSAYWVRLRLQNTAALPLGLVLEAAMPLHDYFDVYYVDGGRALTHYQTGDRYPFDSRPLVGRNFAFPLTLAASQGLDVYIRVDTHDGLYDAIPLTLWEATAYHQAAQTEEHLFGYYYGAILALLIYNLLLFASTRERLFLYYVLYLGSFFTWNVTFRGFAYEYLWPAWSRFNNEVLALSGALIFVSLVAFATNFLNTRHRAPWIHRLLWLLALVCLATLPLALMNIYALSFLIIIPAGMGSLLVLTFVAVREALRGARPARFFLLAWTVLIFSALVYYLRLFGVLPSNFVTENGLNIGSALELILLAYALADRINTLKNEKVAAQAEAHAAQLQLTRSLEERVQERTAELYKVNQRLVQASITDELTELYNRRHFNAVFERELNRARRDNKVFAFAIMDVDHFKQYNDHYGHQKGDQALVQVSHAITDNLKRSSDLAFRLGGEEIGIIAIVDQPEQAQALMEELRAAVECLAIPHQDNTPPVVTASFGLAVVKDYTGVTPHSLYGQADKALYRAKQAGRNRVVYW